MSNQTQAERPAAPVIYTYDKQTGEYKPDAKATCQWSPRENKWLIPAAATTTEPPTAGEKQAACFEAASKTWVLKADYRGENGMTNQRESCTRSRTSAASPTQRTGHRSSRPTCPASGTKPLSRGKSRLRRRRSARRRASYHTMTPLWRSRSRATRRARLTRGSFRLRRG